MSSAAVVSLLVYMLLLFLSRADACDPIPLGRNRSISASLQRRHDKSKIKLISIVIIIIIIKEYPEAGLTTSISVQHILL